MSNLKDSLPNFKDLGEFEHVFNNLYDDIIAKKNSLFVLITSSITREMNKEVGRMGPLEEVIYLEKVFKKFIQPLTQNNQVAVIPERLSKESLWETEFAYLSSNKVTSRLLHLGHKRPYNYANIVRHHVDHDGTDFDAKGKFYNEFVTTIAEKNLIPHIHDYLLSQISELRIGLNSNNFHNSVGTYSTTSEIKSRKAEKQRIKTKNFTSLQWLKEESDRDGSIRDKRLKHLHHTLQKFRFIEKIDIKIFKEHFSGTTNEKPINWISNQGHLIFLLNKLKPYLSPQLFKKNPSPTVISKHFYFDGNPVKIGSLSVMMHHYDNYSNKIIEDKINQIINELNQLN